MLPVVSCMCGVNVISKSSGFVTLAFSLLIDDMWIALSCIIYNSLDKVCDAPSQHVLPQKALQRISRD